MLKKKIVAVWTAAVLAWGIGFSAPALAHDGWSQTNAPIVARGQVSYVDLQFGNHSNEHGSYRISGQWNQDSMKVYVTAPSGKKTDITGTMFYTGEAATETEPAVNNGYIATFSAASPGAYIVTAEDESFNSTSGIRSMSSAKSFVAVGDLPVAARVRTLQGFSRPVSPDRAEFVPMFNPAAVCPDEPVSVQLILEGQPVANTDVTMVRRSNSEKRSLKTDAHGMIAFPAGPADYYLLRAEVPGSTDGQPGESSVKYKATLTFAVQNGIISVPPGEPDPVPYLYVDGQLVEAKGVRIVDGVTYTDASFVVRHLDAGFAGKGSVMLRAAAEELGATVEYLPAVGDTRAAVLIYTKK